MLIIFLVGVIILRLFFPYMWFLFTSLPKLPHVLYYVVLDTIDYYLNKRWLEFNGHGIHIFIGMFGKGKTISAVEMALRYAKAYKHVKIRTNIKLFNFPAHTVILPLNNYNEIVEDEGDTIYLVDEISSIFNSRAFATFPISLLGLLLQTRKQKKMIIATAQRFTHVDKLIRDITTSVYDCDKMQRFHICRELDPYQMEFTDSKSYRILGYHGFVATNKLRKSYDTYELIDSAKKTEFISNKDALDKVGSVSVVNFGDQQKPKKRFGK